MCEVSDTEVVVGFNGVVVEYELYMIFSPLLLPGEVSSKSSAVLRWIKGEEENLLIETIGLL
jgi:hypothetical protein